MTENHESNSQEEHHVFIKPKSIFQSTLSFPQKVAMLSNLSTSYNVTNISLVLPLLSIIYPLDNPDSPKALELESLLASSLLLGMMTGQLLGGALGDLVGRQLAMCIVMGLQVFGSLGCVFFISNTEDSLEIRENLIVWRLILGIGAGGVYPLAALLSAEQSDLEEVEQFQLVENESNESELELASFESDYNDDSTPQIADKSHPTNTTCNQQDTSHADRLNEQRIIAHEIYKSKMIALTFSTQGIGFIIVPIITWIVVSIWGEEADITWRIILGLGSVPGLIIIIAFLRSSYHKSKLHRNKSSEETTIPSLNCLSAQEEEEDDTQKDLQAPLSPLDERCEQHHNNEPMSTSSSTNQSSSHPNQINKTSILKAIRSENNLCTKLLGTAMTWFLFDVLFYGNTLFQPVVMEAAFGEPSDAEYLIQELAKNSAILISLALPGYFVSIYQLNYQTPRFIQSQGFFCMFLLYISIGSFWDYVSLHPLLLLSLYGGTFFFANYGPNATTFMLPSTTFEQVQSRSTLNGIAAASGKFGALIGASLFAPLVDIYGPGMVMILCGCVSLVGFLLTRLFLKSKTALSGNNCCFPKRRESILQNAPLPAAEIV